MSEESKRVVELVEMSPCPFCGSNKFRREEITISGIRVGAENHDLNGFSVSCDSCMTSGPFGKSEHEAVEKWNAPQLARQVEALEAEREWRPIETAPDEGLFLVWLEEPILGSHVHTMHVRPNMRTIASQFAFDCPNPTHWKPLPEPPK